MERVTLILWVSVAFQALAGVLALRLIPLSGRRLAWTLLSAAFLLMMARRTISLLHQEGVIQGEWLHTFAIETVALVISLLIVLGVERIGDIFRKQRQVEDELRKLTLAVEHSPSTTIITDPAGNIEYVNPKFTEVTGYEADEVIGRNPRLLQSGQTSPDVFVDLWQTISAGREWRGEFINRKKTGELYWESASISPVRGADNSVKHYIGLQEDITERKAQAEALAYQATHDALTDLPNRSLFRDRLGQALNMTRRRGGGLSVLMMDLDRFKDINDTLGHHLGDVLLKQVGERLRDTLRGSDTVARLGGDEFAILLPDAAQDAAIRIAQKIAAALARVFEIENQPYSVGASVGIVHYPEHGGDADTLLQRADVAMYEAKREGSDYTVYDEERDPHTVERLMLITELRQAIENEVLVPYYQSKVDIQTGAVLGVEALVRWPHPQRGLLAPDTFIPLAEQTALIRPLTQCVIRAALAQCRYWDELGYRLDMSVNLSVRDLDAPDLPDIVADLLDHHGVRPQCLVFEITENSIMTDAARAQTILGRLESMGVRLAIDDFGTGYSSLANLKRLPVAELKIDKSFVMDMHDDENDAIIVRSTIDLAHNLGLRVVAEGVETAADWDLLAVLGCDIAQGYYMCRPLPAAEFERWLLETQPPGDTVN